MRPLLLVVPIAWLVAGCSSDPVLPEHNINGIWKSFDAPRLVAVGSSVTCRYSTAAIEFVQSGTTLGGRTAGTVFSCGASEVPSITMPIVNGWVRGDSIGFDIGTENIRNVGIFRGDSMSGITTFRIRATPGDVYLIGPFTAVR